MAQEDSAYAGMGTTFTAALVTGREIAIGHVGDSRLYRFRGGELERLTHDHSLVEEFVRQGKLTPEEAEVHPQRSIITRALGPEPDVEVDTYTHPGRDGDVYLLNSDGLTGMISEEQVAEILRDRESLEDAAEKLIAAANENGGKDNITVVLFRLGSDGEDEESGDTLGDQATETGLTAGAVRAEVAKAEATKTKTPQTPAASRSATTRAKVIPQEDNTPAPQAPVRLERAQPLRRRRRRRYVTGVVVIVVIAAVVAGLYALDRKFWFVGTNDRGQVTLYRGLPYDLPLGVSMYSEEYQSAVPVAAVGDARQRKFVLDHHPRSEGDSVSLVHDIERKYARP
jgi:PPM family protein phosphatase